jgi:hypothetical protein
MVRNFKKLQTVLKFQQNPNGELLRTAQLHGVSSSLPPGKSRDSIPITPFRSFPGHASFLYLKINSLDTESVVK